MLICIFRYYSRFLKVANFHLGKGTRQQLYLQGKWPYKTENCFWNDYWTLHRATLIFKRKVSWIGMGLYLKLKCMSNLLSPRLELLSSRGPLDHKKRTNFFYNTEMSHSEEKVNRRHKNFSVSKKLKCKGAKPYFWQVTDG